MRCKVPADQSVAGRVDIPPLAQILKGVARLEPRYFFSARTSKTGLALLCRTSLIVLP